MANSTTYFIYRIICLKTKQSYIGQTVDTQKRWHQHRADLRKGKHHSHKLQEAFWTYGESGFQFEVLEEGIDADNAINREAYWMKEHNGYSNGFNIKYIGHPNDKPAISAVTRYGQTPALPPPPLTVVKQESNQAAPEQQVSRTVHEIMDSIESLVVEMKTRERVALEYAERMRKENEILIRDNAVLRWRLGERKDEDIRVA